MSDAPKEPGEYTKEEWREVVFQMRPEMTHAEFEDSWARFVGEKLQRN